MNGSSSWTGGRGTSFQGHETIVAITFREDRQTTRYYFTSGSVECTCSKHNQGWPSVAWSASNAILLNKERPQEPDHRQF